MSSAAPRLLDVRCRVLLLALSGLVTCCGSAGGGAPDEPDPAAEAADALLPAPWTQRQNLTASDGAAQDLLGYSVSVSGDTALVGAPFGNAGPTESGAAYVFVRSAGAWSLQQKLTPGDAPAQLLNHYFGTSVSVRGDTAIVGAPGDDEIDSGSAYVFTRSGGVWTERQKLSASDGAPTNYFGGAVSLGDDTAIIGSPLDDDSAVDSGSAYVFTRSGSTWIQQQKLTASGGLNNYGDNIGSAVSLSGDTAVLGAYLDDPGGSGSGAAYVFVRAGGVWTEQQKLLASDGGAYAYLGSSVSLSGDTAVLGAPGDDDRGFYSGSVYVFTRSGGAWIQQQKLTAGDGTSFDWFGSSVSVSGTTLIAGACWDAVVGADSGSAYVFTLDGGAWAQAQKLTASNGGADDYFGYSVSVDGDTALFGASLDDAQGYDSGSVYAFAVATPEHDGHACAAGAECISGHCEDGVCCDVACADDCHACSVAAGAAADGTCGPLTGNACDDGDPSTHVSTCQSGTCLWDPTACWALDGCHLIGTYDPATGVCSNPTAADGTLCNDGNACTATDTCVAGACLGTGSPDGICGGIDCVTLQDQGPLTNLVEDAPIVLDAGDPIKATTTFGSVPQMNTGYAGLGYRRIVMKFELAAGGIPSGAAVTEAKLTLRMIQSLGKKPFDVYAGTTPWDESSVTWNQIAVGPNGGLGGLLTSVVTTGVVNNTSLSFSLPASLVQTWFDPSTNYGIVLDHPLSGRTLIGASEAPTATPRPKLRVCYVIPSCSDGVQNNGETGLDCGGPCMPCGTAH